MALMAGTMDLPNRLARNLSRSASTRLARASSIACCTGFAEPSEYSVSTGMASSSHRSGAPAVCLMRTSVYWSAPQNDAVAADIIEEKEPDAERRIANLAVPDEEPAGQGAHAAIAAAEDLDPAVLVGEEHDHVAIARIEG